MKRKTKKLIFIIFLFSVSVILGIGLKNITYSNNKIKSKNYAITNIVKIESYMLQLYNVFPEYKDMDGLVGDSVQFAYPDVILDENGKKISSKELQEGDVVKVFYHQRSEEIAPPILELDEIMKLNE